MNFDPLESGGRRRQRSRISIAPGRLDAVRTRRGVLRRYDFLIGPTTQMLPFDVELPYPTEIDGVPMNDTSEWIRAARASPSPAVRHCRCRLASSDGLPIGMQIVAPVRAGRLLAFAKSVEAATHHAATLPDLLLDRYTARP